jgi:hypothetical protein
MEGAMKSLTLDGFKEWMDMYGKACEDSDPKIAAELFTQNAEYYETPFDEPMIGQDAIYRYWSGASLALKDVQFSYEILAVKRNLGIALWQGKFVSVKSGNHVVLDGVFLVEFDEQEKCSILREWWHRQEIDASPNDP